MSIVKNANISVFPLTLKEHRNILDNLDQFWISKTEFIKPLHHPIFSLIFRDFSFVLKLNEKPVSYVYAARNLNKIFIHVIATKPEFYNRGFGSHLLDILENKARLKKIRSIWCYIVPGNQRSENFFKAQGFIMRKQIKISSDELRILFRKKII